MLASKCATVQREIHLLDRHINVFALIGLHDTFHFLQAGRFQVFEESPPELVLQWLYCCLCFCLFFGANNVNSFEIWITIPFGLFGSELPRIIKKKKWWAYSCCARTRFRSTKMMVKTVDSKGVELTWSAYCLYLAKTSCCFSGSSFHAGQPAWMALIMSRFIFSGSSDFKSLAFVCSERKPTKSSMSAANNYCNKKM